MNYENEAWYYSKKELEEIIQLRKEFIKLRTQSYLPDPTGLISRLSKYSDLFGDEIEYLQRHTP
jgi:hypothetical protein